jgi:zinc protease
VAGAAVDTPVTADAFREMEEEIRGLSRRPPTPEEMALARNALTLSLPRQFETVSQVSGKVATQAAYGLGDDYWERYRERIETVTAEEVVAVAERYLDPSRLVRVAVGDASEVASDLEDLGTLEVRP